MTVLYTHKQTAANNPLLAYTKRTYNGKIFQRASKLVNELGTGAAITYLVQHVRDDLQASYREELWDIATGTPKTKPAQEIVL